MFLEPSIVTKNWSISVTGGVIRLLPELEPVTGDVARGSLTEDIAGVPHSFLTWLKRIINLVN